MNYTALLFWKSQTIKTHSKIKSNTKIKVIFAPDHAEYSLSRVCSVCCLPREIV
jgi:hypothetical protein